MFINKASVDVGSDLDRSSFAEIVFLFWGMQVAEMQIS